MATAAKTCPYCDSALSRNALKCHRCGEWVETIELDPVRAAPKKKSSNNQIGTFGAVVLSLLIVALALRARAGEAYAAQVTGHNAVAIFQGRNAGPVGRAVMSSFGQPYDAVAAQSGGGGTVCLLTRDGVTVEVRDSGLLGTSYGSALCGHLASRGWSRAN